MREWCRDHKIGACLLIYIALVVTVALTVQLIGLSVH